MKRHSVTRLRAPLLAAGLLICAASGARATPIGAFEGPADNAVLTGLVDVWGWAADATAEIDSVILLVDGVTPGRELGYGGERRDVAAAHPEIADALHSGFAAAIHTKNMTNGPHTLTVVARNEAGEETRFDKPVVVSNTPEVGIVWDSIDLSSATSRITDGTLFLDGVVLNGRSYDNLELRFDHFSNAFVIVGFAGDLDRDGFDDEDTDHDGHHDATDDTDEDDHGAAGEDDPEDDAEDDSTDDAEDDTTAAP